MASKSLGQLTIDLIAKVGGFVEGMDKAERAANKRAKDIDKALANMAKGAERHLNAAAKAVGAIGVAAVAGGAALVKSAADSAKEITTLSQVANTSAEDFQRWAVGAKTVGIEQTKLADILKDMNDRVGDFLSTGGGPMKDFFENIAPQIGVTAQQFRKLSGPDALQLYVSSLEKANLSQSEMTFYMEAVASDATALLPLLRDNGAEIGRLGDRAAELGAILSDVEVAQLAEVSKQMDELGLIVEGLGNKIAVAALPAMKQFGDLLQDKDTIAGLQALVQGLVDFTGWAVQAGAGMANFSRWLGEEVAAAINGPAIGDLVRLEQELIDLEQQRQALVLQADASGRAAGEDPRVKALDGQIAKTREMIAVTNDLAADAAKASAAQAKMADLLVPDDLLQRTKSLGAAYGRTGQEIAAAAKKSADAEKDFIKAVEAGAKEIARQREEARKLAEARAKAFGDVSTNVDALQRELAALKMGEAAHKAVLRELAVEAGMRSALSSGIAANDADYRKLIETQYDLAQALADEQAAQEAAKDAAKAAAEESARVWEEAGNRVDEAFADAWKGAFDSFKDFGARIKEALLDLLGELAHMAITRPILVSMGLIGSGTAMAGAPGGMGGAGGFDLSSLTNLSTYTKLLQSNPLAGLGDWITKVGGDSPFLTEVGMRVGDMSALDIGLSAIAGYAGKYLGGKVGEAIFGKEAESSWGATIGGTIGSIWSPIGALLGSALGSAADALFGGDGKKRAALGVVAGTGDFGGTTATGASGLTLSTYVKRAGDEGQQVADALLASFLALDAGLTNVAATLGTIVDLSGENLTGKAPQAGKTGGSFFGSAEFNKLIAEDVTGAADAFVTAWVDRVNELTGAGIDLAPLVAIQREGELLSDVLLRASANLAPMNAALEALGLTAYDVSIAGMALADQLAQAMGGMENFAAATARYYDLFYSEEEKLAAVTAQVADVFAALNLQMPATTAEFRGLVDGLDLTTDAGRAAFSQLLAVAPAFHQVATAADAAAQAAADLAAAQEEQARAAAAAALAARNNTLGDIAGTILEQYQTREATLASLQERLLDLDGDIANVRDSIADASSPIASVVREITTSVDGLVFSSSQLRSLADNLLGTAASLRLGNLSPLNQQGRLEEARRQYDAAQSAARDGDASGLASAAQAYLQQAAAYYASSPAYVAIFDDVTGNLEAMGASLNQQADAAERQERAAAAQQASLDALNQATNSANDLAKLYGDLDKLLQERQLVEQQIANLTATDSLGVMTSQLDRLVAITDGIGSMTDLLANLPASLADQIAAALGVAITEYRALTPTEQFFAPPAFASGGSYGGGLALVGEEGPELINFNRAGYVHNASDTQAMLGGGARLVPLVETLINRVERVEGQLQQRRQEATTQHKEDRQDMAENNRELARQTTKLARGGKVEVFG